MTGVVVRDRRKALLLLAGSRYEVYAPGPKVGRAFQHGKAAATVKELCLLCDGDKVTRDKFGREQTCDSCGGRGWHKVDLMVDGERGSWEEQQQASARTRRALCDHCAGSGLENPSSSSGERCRYCDGAGKVSVPIDRPILSDTDRESDVVLSEWERMLEQREQAGSYREYDKCIAELARRSKHLHDVFHRVYVVKAASPGLLHPTEARCLELAVVKLLGWMPQEIRVPRELLAAEKVRQPTLKGKHVPKRLLASRDAEILERYRAGEKAAEIADALDLHVSSVMRALDRAEAA